MNFNDDALADMFDRPIAFHRALVVPCGGITAALLLSQAIYWQKVATKMGRDEFWKKGTEWLEETGMSRDEFQTARRRLVAAKILLFKVKGVPATAHYRVDFQALALSLRESHKLDVGNPANKVSGIPQTGLQESRKLIRSTEITPENSQRGRARQARQKTIKTQLPVAFAISDRVNEWARKRGVGSAYVVHCFDGFIGDVRANGRVYADWDEALMNFIRRQPQFERRGSIGTSVAPLMIDRQWFDSPAGVERRAHELGMEWRGAHIESFVNFTKRVREADEKVSA